MNPTAINCPLCASDGGELVWMNGGLRVVTVDEPDLPGYTRVILNRHVAEMTELAATEQLRIMELVFLVEAVQRSILGPDKVNLASLGNMTPHVHWHVIPRWRNDPWFPDSIWSARHERDAATQTESEQTLELVSALQGEYVAALRLALEKNFGKNEAGATVAMCPLGTAQPQLPDQARVPVRSSASGAEPTPKRDDSGSAGPANRLCTLPSEQLAGLHPDWQAALSTPRVQDALAQLDTFLAQRLQEGATIFPAHIFRALEALAPQDVRVVILGQDPYHGPGQAQGLAFSVPNDCPTPPSLRNMFNELAQEYPDLPRRRRNDLSDWAEQGVLLLNTSLTVEQGAAGSHARKGWELVTDAIIDTVAKLPLPTAFLLWGNHAQSKAGAIEAGGKSCKLFMANHPSPLSALRPPRPFIGCGHFAQANAWLAEQGLTPVDWVGNHE